MAWVLTSKGTDLVIDVNESGPQLRADATGEFFTTHLHSLPSHGRDQLGKVRFAWSIMPPSASEGHMDNSGQGLYRRAMAAPSKCHVMIKLWTNEYRPQGIITLTCVVPERIFISTWDMAKLVIAEGLDFQLSTPFMFFRMPQANIEDLVSWEDFSAGAPIFETEISFKARRPEAGSIAAVRVI